MSPRSEPGGRRSSQLAGHATGETTRRPGNDARPTRARRRVLSCFGGQSASCRIEGALMWSAPRSGAVDSSVGAGAKPERRSRAALHMRLRPELRHCPAPRPGRAGFAPVTFTRAWRSSRAWGGEAISRPCARAASSTGLVRVDRVAARHRPPRRPNTRAAQRPRLRRAQSTHTAPRRAAPALPAIRLQPPAPSSGC